jgi:hypothetical protein
MSGDLPPAAMIEIVERNRITDETAGGSSIIPDQVRINGIPLLVPAGESVKVHEITLGDRDVVCVTLTLFARRVTIAAEGDLSGDAA